MNYQMETFHQDLVDLINGSGLPIGAAYWILKDCLNELEMGYRKAIFNEKNNPSDPVTETIPLTNEMEEDNNDETSSNR